MAWIFKDYPRIRIDRCGGAKTGEDRCVKGMTETSVPRHHSKDEVYAGVEYGMNMQVNSEMIPEPNCCLDLG